MPKLPHPKNWPWIVQKAAEITVIITLITTGFLFVGQLSDYQPLATKTWVGEYVQRELNPIQKVQVDASGERSDIRRDMSALTVQTLTFQILQMQLQLESLTDKGAQMSFADRQLAQRLRDEITKSQSLVEHAECVQNNEGRQFQQQPCS